MLRKQPGITALALLALMLGIGANTAIFSVVNAVLLRPLPVKDPDSLMFVWGTNPKRGWGQTPASAPNFLDWKARSHSFDRMSISDEAGYTLTGQDSSEAVTAFRGDGEFFNTLGVPAMLGRTFQPDDDRPGHEQVAVLSYGFWQQHYGANQKILGHTISLSGKPYEVIGVMPPHFDFPDRTSLWTPLALGPADLAEAQRGHGRFVTVARLKKGVTVAAARAEMDGVAKQLAQAYPEYDKEYGITVLPIKTEYVGEMRPMLLVLQGAAAFVLLIACANVANLLLARAASRRREIAVRVALGASRFRLIRQLLTECLLLAAAGGVCGVLAALWGLDGIVSLLPSDLPFYWKEQIGLSGGVLAASAVIALATGVIFGLAPAWSGSRPDLVEQLKDGGHGGSTNLSHHRLRNTLAVAEVALSLVLLIGAGLMTQTLLRLRHVNLGFSGTGIIDMVMTLPDTKYKTGPEQAAFYDRLLARVKGLPQVRSAAIINEIPVSDSDAMSNITLRGMAEPPPDEYPTSSWRTVTPDYFATIGITLEKGRVFTPQDGVNAAGVCILSREAVDRFWTKTDPIGRQLRLGSLKDKQPWLTVVGIVSDVHHFGPNGKPTALVYVPFAQRPQAAMYLLARTGSDPMSLASPIRAQITDLDRDLVATSVETMEQRIAETTSGERIMTWLLGVFGGLALLLAALGVYAVISYSVIERTKEIGIRMALGARPAQVLRMVIRQGLRLAGAGVAIGLAAAWGLTQLLSDLLFGVEPTDLPTFLSLCAVLAAVAAAACYIPARRATQVDPLVTLKYE
jgi:putative ABC transport system permease protein